MQLTDEQRDALDQLPAFGGILPKQIGVSGNTLARLARLGLAWSRYIGGARYYGLTDRGRWAREQATGEAATPGCGSASGT